MYEKNPYIGMQGLDLRETLILKIPYETEERSVKVLLLSYDFLVRRNVELRLNASPTSLVTFEFEDPISAPSYFKERRRIADEA